MNRTRILRGAVAAAAGLASVAGLALAPTARATASFELTRVQGVDRYDTASKLAAEAFTAVDDAVIARGDGPNFADALAGSYLAGGLGSGSPLLLTQKASVPNFTRTRLQALGVKNVRILGGTDAVSQAVEADLAEDFTVTRVQGVNRYDTAAKIAAAHPAGSIGTVSGKRTAFLATGVDAADALAAGPVSYAKRLPVLLTTPATLSAEAKKAIADLAITHVVILGGINAVSAAVETEVKATGATTERVQGLDRYETAGKVADFAIQKLAPWSSTAVDLANGITPADALAGGPTAGEAARSIVLTRATDLPAATEAWLEKMSGTLTSGRVYGGPVAVSVAVEEAAEEAGQGSAATSGQVVAVDKAADTYHYVAEGADEATSVTYKATDSFTIDGSTATFSAFEAALTVADRISYIEGATTSTHQLTNVNAANINEGMVGNVDIADTQFDIIDPVTGNALRSNITYGSANTYVIDGAANKTQAEFSAAINEGDLIDITGTALALDNEDVVGPAGDIEAAGSPLSPVTRLTVDGLGDIADAGSDGQLDQPGQDDKYAADGDDTFTGEATTYDAFAESLSDGDRVTYRRINGEEIYNLVNVAPPTRTGQAADDLAADADGVPLTPDTNDGGSFTLVTEDGPVAVEYEPGGAFVVNGAVATEENFEDAYSAGDTISYRAADDASGTSQRLELTDAPLSGDVDPESVDTAEDTYAVLGEDGETQLATVSYAEGSDDTFFVNGQPRNLEQFEAELTAIAEGTKTGSVVVTESGTVQTHRLTTSAA